MRIKYSPCKSDKDTDINIIDDNTISIDGELYEFDKESIEFPMLAELTDYIILEAHRKSEELFLTIKRFYSGNCTEWDTGDYHVY